ncbi:hypothetical protein KCV07_g7407, partial [Aureobasidium melanogenum]
MPTPVDAAGGSSSSSPSSIAASVSNSGVAADAATPSETTVSSSPALSTATGVSAGPGVSTSSPSTSSTGSTATSLDRSSGSASAVPTPETTTPPSSALTVATTSEPAKDSSSALTVVNTSEGTKHASSALNTSTGMHSNTSAGNSTSLPSPNQHSKTNVGTMAGAAVGAAVGAAILAFVVTYLLMRSRLSAKKRTKASHVLTPDDSTYAMNKGYFSESVVESKCGSGDWMRHLPQPADDVSIITTIETICQQIELHIDNFYSNTERPLDSISKRPRALLTEIDTGLVRPPLSEAMMRYRNKTTLIKQALAHMILSNITIEDGSPGSLLPQDIAELQKSLQSVTRYRNMPATSQALAYTRFLVSYLRPAPYDDQALLAQRDSTIKTMATTFCVALEPWSSQGTSSDARYLNLVEIMRGAATGGLLLFSQRATFKFDWDLGDKRPGNNIVVLPGLVKITDDKARPLDKIFVCKPQVVAELR